MKKSFGYKVFSVFNYLFFILIIVVCLLPVLHVIFASLSDPAWVISQQGLIWRIKGLNLNGYKLVFQNKSLLISYGNTIFYVFIATSVGMLITVMAAYALSRKEFLLRNVIMFLITFTMLFSGGIIPLYLVVTQTLGWHDSRLAIIFPTCVSAFNLIIVRTAIASVPQSLEESARIDGAGRFTILFKIIVPLIKPTIATIILYYAVGHWNSWFHASIFLTTRDKFPLQLVLKEILVSGDMSSNATISSTDFAGDAILYKQIIKYCTIVLSSAPIFVFYPFIQKYFESGVMVGAVKG
ncbi:MAG: carbohydrate ABC transporter permease [Lachnospiraceae bacterium]|nr:carbohydrate ABC transporter permease [Lachnospiraceae bacterium]